MDVQRGSLDDKGERFRGKDAAKIVSGIFCSRMMWSYLLSEIDICGPYGEM